MSEPYRPFVALVDMLSGNVDGKEALIRTVRSGVSTAPFRAGAYSLQSLVAALESGDTPIDGAVLFADGDFFYSNVDAEVIFVDFLDQIIALGLHRLVIVCDGESWDENICSSGTETEDYLALHGFPMEQFALEACPVSDFYQQGDKHLPGMKRAVEAINRVILAPAIKDAAFRMPIQQVFSVKELGVVAVGVVEKGSLQPGDRVEILGDGKRLEAEVAALEMFRRTVSYVEAGDDVGVFLRGVSADELARGMVMTAANAD
ncbi:MAG: hypothetical protein IJB75_08220 [Oscillospiraceae bacterium]|nr:hypothetical protein [Oscillospiraceae bacterium]